MPSQDVAPSTEVIETDTDTPAQVESGTPVPAPGDEPLSTAVIVAATADPALLRSSEPVTLVPAQEQDVAFPPKVIEQVIPNEKSTGSLQVEELVVPPIDHHVRQKKVVGLSQLNTGEPSMVRKVDGQYAVWNHGSAQGVQVGDEVKLVRGAEQIGRGQVIAVRANDCDLEIAETYAVASVAVGDHVKPVRRATTP